jgi:hypothetical protein
MGIKKAVEETRDVKWPATPRGGVVDYQYGGMGIPGDMVDQDSAYPPPNLEAAFHQNACMIDGCSGKLRIDTLYDNIVQTEVINPRSLEQGPPDMVVGPDTKAWLYPQRDNQT